MYNSINRNRQFLLFSKKINFYFSLYKDKHFTSHYPPWYARSLHSSKLNMMFLFFTPDIKHCLYLWGKNNISWPNLLFRLLEMSSIRWSQQRLNCYRCCFDHFAGESFQGFHPLCVKKLYYYFACCTPTWKSSIRQIQCHKQND